MGFAEAFRGLRQQKGASQSELARRSGVAVRTLAYWESGHRLPRVPELTAALDALEITSTERRQIVALLPTTRSLQMTRLEAKTDPILLQEQGPLPELGDLLRAMRMRRGWTQEQLAAALGMKRFATLRWETTQHLPSEESLERVCDLLGAYPEEKRTLQARRLLSPSGEAEDSLEACAEDTAHFLWQINLFQTPLIDLQALVLKRRLRLLAGESSEALRLLAMVEVDHSSWLMFHERMSESHAATWRALHLLQGRFAPERLWVNALNLASVHSHLKSNKHSTAFRLLQDWLPRMPDNYLRTILLCDMAVYAAFDDKAHEANILLREAQRTAHLPEDAKGEEYFKLTSARVRMRTQRTVEDLEWLLELSASPNQRLSFLLMWVRTLLAAGEKHAASHYLTLACAEVTPETTPRIQRQIGELARAF